MAGRGNNGRVLLNPTCYSLGSPIGLFTPVLAVSRMSGWTAHILEQYHNTRLVRPRSTALLPHRGGPRSHVDGGGSRRIVFRRAAGQRDRACFAKSQSYMVLLED